MKKIISLKKGFTLLEILLVVGIIAILAGIVILAINPSKQLGDTRNAQRRSDVLSITNAVYQYMIDHNGTAPTSIPTGTCGDLATLISTSSDHTTSVGSVDLYTTLVTASSTYLNDMPRDPLAATSSGYGIVEDTISGRITVCAPRSLGEGNIPDGGPMISVTR